MKLQNNKTSKQRELIIDNNNKEIREKFDQFKKENEVLKSKLSVTEKTSLIVAKNFKNIKWESHRNEEKHAQDVTVLPPRIHGDSRYFE